MAKATKPMTKKQIVDTLAEKLGQPKKVAESFITEYTALAYKGAKLGFTLPGLGKLVLVSRKARKGRNPATGQEIKIPAKKVLKFRIAKAAKDSVLGK